MPEPIAIREVTLRECRQAHASRGRYTSGGMDPETIVWLFVSVSDGRHTGYGECVPTSLFYEPGHIGRSSLDEWEALLGLCASLPGQDARRLGRLVPDEMRCYDANSVIDAVDFALHDLVGRASGLPVAALLGGVHRPWVWAVPVVHTDTPENMARQTAEWREKWGFCYFKLKPIGTLEADAETLRRMREKMGPKVRYYMDANYALKMTPDELVAYLNELHPLGLEVYEDPIDADFATYRHINDRTPVRVMIDEKARTPEAVMEILREKAAGQVNIHANWAGGFQPALFKANVAAMGGMPTMIGSTIYLGPGAAAYQTLGSVLPLEAPVEQVYTEVRGHPSAIQDPYEIRDGKIFIRQAPGLGVTPDMEAIDSITVRSETFG